MKKFYILLIAMALTAGSAFAQSNDSIERAKQQQELLKQQQKEQEALLKQQQKEQERLLKEQQKAEQKAQEERRKEQEKLIREQQKEQEQAIKKEQDRQKREQAKAESKLRKEQKKAEKERKRQEHYAAWGRKPSFTADPYVSILTDRLIYGKNNYYNSVGANLGVTFDYHRPIARHWDFNVGLGYRYTIYCYSHVGVTGNANDHKIYEKKEFTANLNTIVVPIKLSHINKDNEHGWYVGLVPGFNFPKKNIEGAELNSLRCDFAVGTQSRWFIFSPGTEVYLNLLPTYKSGTGTSIREFGIRFNL